MGARNIVSDDEEEYEESDIRDARDTEAVDEEDEEEAEEEGQDEYEKDGFIVDDVEEEEEEARESSDEEMKARKKKRKKREAEENYELDEDDYELLQEANVTGFHRPKSGSKKFKRLKKAGKNDRIEEKTGFSDEDELEEGGWTGATAEEKLKRSLFGDDEGVPPEDVAEEEDQLEEEEEEDMGEEDEMADFIVDEEEVDENGLPVRRRRKSKKRISRQAPGISSIALQEAQDIFGDVDELLSRRKQGLKARGFDGLGGLDDDQGGRRLEDEFEPSILAEKYMTAKDDDIRETDVPERFQLSEEITGPVPHNENTVPEAKWIYEQVFGSLAVPIRKEFQHIAQLDKEEVVKDIANVLKMFHDQKLEVPFIAMYRKEMCLNLLRDLEYSSTEAADKSADKPTDKAADKEKKSKMKMYKALWEIQLRDRKWLLLQRRKTALKASYEKRAGEEARRDPIKWKLLETVFQSLDDAESERTIDDLDTKFNLHFPPDEIEVEEGQFKRPKRKSMYSICRKSGLGAVSRNFGLTSEQLGKNLLAMYKMHEVEDDSNAPEDVAAGFSAGEFGDPQSVLKGARHMAAVEISCEPAVKEYARTFYMEKAVVTTKPTADGNNAIGSFHQYARVKWLNNKPISKFDDAQWLLIQKAEEEKLLQVTIGLPKDDLDGTLMNEFEAFYLSDGVSRSAQLWNEQRKLILKDAICNYILPSMEKEARIVLSARAKNWLVQDYGYQLWKRVSVAPFQRQKPDNDESSEEDAETRIMVCCQGSNKDPTTFVMLDPAGEVLDILFTSHLSIRSKNSGLQKRKENDQQRLLKFMMDHQPHIVVLGASNLRCKYLKDDIFEVIFKIVEEHPRDLAEGLDTINVVYADEFLPTLYENSRISQDQLPTQRGIVRRAVALGRYLQNPLAMVATLCGPGKEILSLKLHSLEHFLSLDDKYEAVEQVMVTVTNQVGVDINLAASHEWMFSPLQFVAGLGPRKAASIQRAILRAGRVYSRRELLTPLEAMKRLVFINAAGFLRVRGTGQAASGNHVMDPLDDTRIHPESYELAKKMAEDVYCEDAGQDIDDMDEETQEMAVEHVKKYPNLLMTLDIDEYARSVEQRTSNKKRETLADVKIELVHGFKDWRTPYKEPSQDEEFYLLTGENEETLSVGKIVQATARRVLNNRIICDLESGLTGIIMKEQLSDDIDIDPIEKVAEGSILTCRVKSMQKAKYLVDLTCKASELRNDNWQPQNGEVKEVKDPYFAKADTIKQSEQENARKAKELAKKSFKPRMIVHPRFLNISEDETIKFLSDKDAGESIIRPSLKGPTHLMLTLKIFDGVYAHKDIVEGGKDHRDFASFLRLGKTLSIGEETFEDLDEVIDRYVDPLISNLKAILDYRKFRRGTKAEVDDALRKEKYENPTRIPYYISVSHEHPGAFLLSYIRSTNPHHEYFGLYPKGFKFRKRMFDNLDKLVSYFQKHINDLVQQDSLPPIRSVAAMVPMKSPGPGGSAGGGGSVGSGWGGSATNSGGGGDGGWAGSAMDGGRGGDGGWRGSATNSGGDGWQGPMGTDWERSSTPGSRTGGNDYHLHSASGGLPSGLPRPPNSRERGRGVRGGGSSSAGWNEGRDGGFDRGGNEGRGGGMRGRWSEDGRNRWGRNNGRGIGSGRGANEANINNRWGRNSGDAWGSKTEEWGSNSGSRIPESPARGAWPVSSGESELNRRGSDGWDTGKLSDGWNSAKVSDRDATLKDSTGRQEGLSKVGDDMPSTSKDWAKQPSGWDHAAAGSNGSVGGSGWES
ncbi:transcription elongation factor SPT6-like isoform X2 [Cryptomeria japonica]|uniref:transcription elongation factor SPT6-like isoform X2 n=1 Tax=Cryptomeria japonica TaxID=3369 RepID=UPI0025ABB26B|nr:transcription elongation factor SPT6-like isoform X2 [Cryptomeria japonica]